MKQYSFSNSNIDLAGEEVEQFLTASGVDRREVLRNKLSFEEVLLDYQEKFGEEAVFSLKCGKRLSSIKVELVVEGRPFDPFDEAGEEDDVIRGLLARIGLAPTYSYKNGKNYIVFIAKKKSLSGTVKMVAAIALAIFAGLGLNLLPDGIRQGINDYALTPVTDTFMGLISAVSVPLVFLSILSSICSMGNMETLGKIGTKTLKAIFLHMIVIGVFVTVLASCFYPIQWDGGGASGFSQVLDLIYDIVPSNLFEPFVTGNMLQLIFIAIMIGLAMLVLSSRVNGVYSLIEQLSSIVQTIMSGLSSILPVLIFVIFTGMIAGGNLGTLLNSWKMIAVIMLLLVAFYVVNLLRVAFLRKVSPALLMRKTWQTFVISLTTASSAAAFGTNVRDANKKLGMDKTLVEFAIPLGQVLFDPAGVATLTGIELTMAQLYGIPITPSFLMIAFITNLLLSFATPPVPGGGVMCYTIAFSQLGIPLEAIGIVLVADMIIDFPGTACSVSGWQLIMIDVADSLGMLNKEKLRKKN
ncbi:MAG: dicarboxylate/amino acid:cation symporter [Oscillospiraceae bacterium]|nr:dicarboxylate/amino acid:cation symporter [Oscillospiraceae bacterium]